MGVMIAFSLGTIPALLGVPVFQRVISLFNDQFHLAALLSSKIRVKLIIPAIVLVIGVVLTARGLRYGERLETVGQQHDPEALCAPAHTK
jgi:sulfite exporter TauE/SafE